MKHLLICILTRIGYKALKAQPIVLQYFKNVCDSALKIICH